MGYVQVLQTKKREKLIQNQNGMQEVKIRVLFKTYFVYRNTIMIILNIK